MRGKLGDPRLDETKVNFQQSDAIDRNIHDLRCSLHGNNRRAPEATNTVGAFYRKQLPPP